MSARDEHGSIHERIPLVAGGLVVVLAVMALRVAQLTIVDREELAGRAQRQHRETVRVTGMRGPIRDRNGEVLAETVYSPSIYASPRKFPVPPEVRPQLASILGVSPRLLDRRLDSNSGFAWLKRRATRDQARAIAALGLPGVGSIPEGRRLYPQGGIGAHVIGVAGADLHGLEGIELRYDRWMRGPESRLRVERDGLGRVLLTGGMDPDDGIPDGTPELEGPPPLAAGASLSLTIDAGLQALVERELAAGVASARADAGTAIMLDPRSGAILALANVPTYDPNRPGEAVPGGGRNRAVTDFFEPGSTFKAILAAAALEERAVTPADSVFCENGSYRIGKWTIHDHHPYGLLTIPEVIQYSSNIGVSKIAERLGRDRYARYLGAFGFGRRTMIDLPGEVSGMIRPVRNWAQIDLATGSFGQGLAVTPIQLASAFGALANGGVLHQPHLLSAAADQNGRVIFDRDLGDQDASSRRVVSPETAASVTSMLERVVQLDGGTGSKARIPGVRVAGKTGTAQKVDSKTGRYSKERLASFVGFAPAEDPAFVLVVMIDNPRGQTYGGQIAAPVFAQIMSRAIDRRGDRPARVELPLPVRPHAPSPAPIPAARPRPPAGIVEASTAESWPQADTVRSFLGLSLRRALAIAKDDGLVVEARGSGLVKDQDPPPGVPRVPGDTLVLYLEPTA